MTDLERRVTELLAELAEAQPVEELRRPAARELGNPGDDRREEYPVRSLEPGRRQRSLRPVLVGLAAALVVALLIGTLALVRDDGSPVSVSAATLSVDTAELGAGRMAVVVENDLYVADGPTGAVWKLTDVGPGEEVSDVSFSHDGEWVAFTIHDESGLWVSRWDGSERHRIGRAPSSYAWSPTDHQLAYATQDEVRVAQTDGSSRDLDGGSAPKAHTRVAWSPDGTTLAFVLDPGGVTRATLQGNPGAGWSTFNPPADEVLAWPTPDQILVRNAWPSADDDPNVDRLALVEPVLGRVSELAQIAKGSTPSAVGGSVAVINPDRKGASVCDLGALSCSPASIPEGTWMDVSLSPGLRRVAVIGTRVAGADAVLNAGDLGSSTGFEFSGIDGAARGTVEVDGVGYGVDPDPIVWETEEALLVRTYGSAVEAFSYGGSRSTVVRGDRFLPPEDDYPGGVGLAYWAPR